MQTFQGSPVLTEEIAVGNKNKVAESPRQMRKISNYHGRSKVESCIPLTVEQKISWGNKREQG